MMSKQLNQLYEFGEFRLDPTERVLWHREKPVPLPPKAFETLLVLVRRGGHLVEKDELMKQVWADAFVEEANLARNIWTLRKALGDDEGEHRYIETVPKLGYRFVAPVRELPNEAIDVLIQRQVRARIVTEAEDPSSSRSLIGAEQTAPTGSEILSPSTSEQMLMVPLAKASWWSKRNSLSLLIAVAAFVFIVLLAAVILSRGYFAASGEAIDSVAVLPFVDINKDPNTEYLSDGLSDSIINSLSRLPTLRVMSLNSVLRYKGKQIDPHVVGRELNVRAVLIGRFVKQGDNLAISTELVDVRDNRRLWGEQYNRKLSDIIVVQTEIAREISENLRLRLTSEDKKQLAKRYTENSEAYQLYLLGRYHLRKLSKEGFEKALEYFEQAINTDPAYAPAYVGVAIVYSELGLRGLMLPKEAQQKAESAARKALQLDDTLAEVHASMGYIKERDWDWSDAEKEFKRALELDPGSVDVNLLYSGYLIGIGRPDEALPYAKRAYELDGPSPNSLVNLAAAYAEAGKDGQAIELYLKAIEMDPNFAPAHAQLGYIYLGKSLFEDAIKELQKAKDLDNSPERQGRFAWLACAYASSGKKAEAQKMLDELKGIAKQRYIPPYNFALIYAALGDNDEAFASLEKPTRSTLSSWVRSRAIICLTACAQIRVTRNCCGRLAPRREWLWETKQRQSDRELQ